MGREGLWRSDRMIGARGVRCRLGVGRGEEGSGAGIEGGVGEAGRGGRGGGGGLVGGGGGGVGGWVVVGIEGDGEGGRARFWIVQWESYVKDLYCVVGWSGLGEEMFRYLEKEWILGWAF